MKTQTITLSAFFLSLLFVGAIFSFSCNLSTNRYVKDMSHQHYVVTLEENFDKEYLLSIFGESIEKVGHASKTGNTYVLIFREDVHIDSIITQNHIMHVEVDNKEISAPIKISGVKGKSKPIE